MCDLWTDAELRSDSRYDGSSDEGGKEQDNIDDQEQEEVVSFTRRNPRRIRRGDERSLRHLKSEIGILRDKLFLIKHLSAGSTHSKWYLVHVGANQSDPFSMSYYGVYQCRWYIIQHKYLNQHRTMECFLW